LQDTKTKASVVAKGSIRNPKLNRARKRRISCTSGSRQFRSNVQKLEGDDGATSIRTISFAHRQYSFAYLHSVFSTRRQFYIGRVSATSIRLSALRIPTQKSWDFVRPPFRRSLIVTRNVQLPIGAAAVWLDARRGRGALLKRGHVQAWAPPTGSS